MEMLLEGIALIGLLSVAIMAYVIGLIVAVVTEEMLLGGAAFAAVIAAAYYFWQALSISAMP